MIIQTWADVTIQAFQKIWQGFINSLPNILGALLVFFIGWAIAIGLHRLVTQILRMIKLDPALEKIGAGKAFEKAGIKMDVANWIGVLVKWFLIFVFLLAATEILGLQYISEFLKSVVIYIPNIIVAAIILVVGAWLAGFLQKLVIASVTASKIKSAAFVGTIVKWAILIFALLTALQQLGVAYYLQTLVTGLIAMLAIAGGLAFGLGGKEQAAGVLKKIKDEMND